MTEAERCKCEIAAIEDLIRSGHLDVEGLCLAVSDWHTELRILESMPRGMPLAKRELVRGAEAIYGRGLDLKSSGIAGRLR